MGEKGWLTRYCYGSPLEVQRTHDCVFKIKNQARTNRLCLLVYVPLGVGWVVRLAVGWLVGWVGGGGRFVRG